MLLLDRKGQAITGARTPYAEWYSRALRGELSLAHIFRPFPN